MNEREDLTCKEIFEKLGIGKYGERIFNSHSHGELFFIDDYRTILRIAEGFPEFLEWFPGWFEHVVEGAEKNWTRPESVFQHILELLKQRVDER